MNSLLKNILSAERIDELLSIAKGKTVALGDFFIHTGEVAFKVSFFFDGLFKFQSGEIPTVSVSMLSTRQHDPETEIIVSRARVEAFKA